MALVSVTELTAAIVSFIATGAWQGARLLSEEERNSTEMGKWYPAVIEGNVIVGCQTVRLQFGFTTGFPDELPVAWLAAPGCLGKIPHEDELGQICYHRNEGMVVNRHDPNSVLEDALHQAIAVLRAGAAGANHLDFMDEFAAYWRRLDARYSVCSIVDPAPSPKSIALLSHEGKPEWLADSPNAATKFHHTALPNRVVRRCIYVPLRPGTHLESPSTQQFWTLRRVREILDKHVAAAHRSSLHRLMRQRDRSNSNELLVLGIPRPSGGETLVGIEFSGVRNIHPMLFGGTCTGIFPVQIERRDRTYLLPRGGGALDLARKQVLLVGCGAIGGYAAMALASAGIGKLTLVDHDRLAPENCFRHVLGRAGLYLPKSEALKLELERRYPFIEVRSVPKKIQAAIHEKDVNLARYDAIIVALGAATVELRVNEMLHALKIAPPTVFTWLEPLGIGGHALLTGGWGNGWVRGGCMECLYTNPEPSEPLFVANRAAFADSAGDYTLDVLGCGGAFVPFAGLDAQRTAEISLRLVLSALSGAEPGHPLLSWTGDSTAFLKAGFTLSSRFEQGEADRWEGRYAYHIPHCRVCGQVN